MKTMILGGGYAGVLCALRLARQSEGEVTVVDGRDHFVERVRLHEHVAPTIPYRQIFAGTRVQFRRRFVEDIDLVAQRADGEAFDRLVIATGSRATEPRMPGHERFLRCSTLEDAENMHRIVGETRGPVVVVGGGLTGIELAAELGATLVTRGALGGGSLSEAAVAHVRRGMDVIEHADVAAVEDGALITSDGRSIPCAAAIWAGGFSATPLPCDLERDTNGRLRVDEHLRSISHPSVHVAGDAASSGLRMACATAMPTGAYVADLLSGRTEQPFRFGFIARCISLGRKNGLVQWVDPWDRPRGATTGRLAAWMKELIVRYTILAMRLERRGFAYRWSRGAPLLAERAGSAA